MKRFKLTLSNNPVFQTVTGLTNTTFDGTNVVESRGATEGQLLAVYNTYQEIKTFLDENGCDADTYAYLRERMDELLTRQTQCCETDWGANSTAATVQKLSELETRIEQCCTVDHGEQDVSAIVARIDELEARIEECCNKTCFDQGTGSTSQCDGNVITVSFGWNGNNPYLDGGKATAVSSMSDHSIVGYHFLYNFGSGFYKVSTLGKWSIDSSGNVVHSGSGVSGIPYYTYIIATDDHGCEGSTRVLLPAEQNTGGG